MNRPEIEALAARHAKLEAELAAAQRERDEVAKMIDERRRLPVLPHIRMANPCPADWNAMVGDDRVRACVTCNKSVFNLSAMTRADAEALIVSKHGDLCAQYWQRADGTILLKDCTVQLTRRRRRLAAFAAVTALAGTALVVRASEVPAKPQPRPPVHVQLRRVDSVPAIVQPVVQPGATLMRGGMRLERDPVTR
jgi:hypothetical protein